MSTKTLDRTVKAGRVYEADLYGWVEDQVALLKAGDVGSIDASHITRELEDLGRSEFNKLVGALRVVLLHLLKMGLSTGAPLAKLGTDNLYAT